MPDECSSQYVGISQHDMPVPPMPLAVLYQFLEMCNLMALILGDGFTITVI